MNPILRVPLSVCCVMLFLVSSAKAQTPKEPALQLRTEHVGSGENKGLEISATTLKPGSYSVMVIFHEQHNMNEPQKLLRVVKGPGAIVRISPTDTKQPMSCRYRYVYTQGYEPRKVDSAFVYRLPFSTNRQDLVRVAGLHNVDQRYFNRSKTINWNSLQFRLEKGDTIFAIRKGEVVRIQDGFDPVDREELISYSSSVNLITVEHSDGTICDYKVMEKGSFMVSEGDMVYPGTPLGLCGLQNISKNDYQLKLSIHYPVYNSGYDVNDSKSSPFLYAYYNPVFATHQGELKLVPGERYMAVSSEELVQKEMTKKELKKR